MNLLKRALSRIGLTADAGVSNERAWNNAFGWGRSTIKGLPSVNESTALSHGTVYACCNALAQDVSKLRLELHEGDRDGDSRPVRDHPAARLLGVMADPETRTTPQTAKYAAQSVLGLRGNSYVWTPRNGDGHPFRFVPIPANRVSVLRSGNAVFYDFTDPSGVSHRVGPDEMVHLRHDARDGVMGRSPIAVAAETFGVALAAQQFAGRSFSEDRLRAYLSHPDWFQDDEQATAHAKRIRASLSDPEAGGIPILPFGMELKEIGLSPADAGLLTQMKLDREQIISIFGVTPARLGIFEHGVKANAEQQQINYIVDGLTPWTTLWEQQLAASLLTDEERDRYFFAFALDDLLKPSTKDYGEYLYRQATGGIMTREEARQRQNLPAQIPSGHTLYPPPNMTDKSGAAPKENDDE